MTLDQVRYLVDDLVANDPDQLAQIITDWINEMPDRDDHSSERPPRQRERSLMASATATAFVPPTLPPATLARQQREHEVRSGVAQVYDEARRDGLESARAEVAATIAEYESIVASDSTRSWPRSMQPARISPRGTQ